ncbi:MAG: aminotransferase class I/II-fold pyridoxal phosphate-dependent enzyme [Planctomycetota bacterium]
MIPIAHRLDKLNPSGIRKVFALAATIKDPINLSIGQPDFDVPDIVKETARTAITAGFNRYTSTEGIPELHARLLAFEKNRLGRDGALLVTSGVSGALALAFLSLVNPGDEVLIPDPYFVMYKHLVNLCGGVPRFINTYPDFRLREEAIRPLLSDRTKILILNSPTNPTGAVMGRAEIEMAARIARERKLLVISDEIYGAFAHDGPADSVAKLHSDTLVLNGFSKTWAMTGWRLGWAFGPGEVIEAMTRLQQFTFVCAPSFAQKAALVALDTDVSGRVAEYRAKRDRVINGLSPKFELAPPAGAFYAFPKAPWGTATEFVQAAIAEKVLVIPGNVFSERDTHFRISYAAPDAVLDKGIAILNQLADK